MNFLYADIYEEGLVERVSAANDASVAHHAARDAQNAKMLEELQGQWCAKPHQGSDFPTLDGFAGYDVIQFAADNNRMMEKVTV